MLGTMFVVKERCSTDGGARERTLYRHSSWATAKEMAQRVYRAPGCRIVVMSKPKYAGRPKPLTLRYVAVYSDGSIRSFPAQYAGGASSPEFAAKRTMHEKGAVGFCLFRGRLRDSPVDVVRTGKKVGCWKRAGKGITRPMAGGTMGSLW